MIECLRIKHSCSAKGSIGFTFNLSNPDDQNCFEMALSSTRFLFAG